MLDEAFQDQCREYNATLVSDRDAEIHEAILAQPRAFRSYVAVEIPVHPSETEEFSEPLFGIGDKVYLRDASLAPDDWEEYEVCAVKCLYSRYKIGTLTNTPQWLYQLQKFSGLSEEKWIEEDKIGSRE